MDVDEHYIFMDVHEYPLYDTWNYGGWWAYILKSKLSWVSMSIHYMMREFMDVDQHFIYNSTL